MDYAGYDYEDLVFPDDNKVAIFEKIKVSIDKDTPVLALFGRLYQWILITGYDENGLSLCPTGTKSRTRLCIRSKKEPTVTIQNVFKRGIKIMESMKKKSFTVIRSNIF